MSISGNKGKSICFLMEDFYPFINGSVIQVLLLGERLSKSGLKVMVVTRKSGVEQTCSEDVRGIDVFRVKPDIATGRYTKYLMILPAFYKLFQERQKYSAIIVCDFKVLGVVGVIAALLLRKKCFLRAESCGEMDGSFATTFDSSVSGLKNTFIKALVWLRNSILLKADGFLSISSVITTEYLESGVDKDKIINITNGIDVAKFSPVSDDEKTILRKQLNLMDKKYFVYSGRLTKGKGLEYLIRAWRKIVAEFPEAHLILIGSGKGYSLDIENELASYCRENNLEATVTFTGNINNVHEYLQAVDCFLLPSQTESLSISLIEALSCELPCIATGVGGILDYVEDNVNGLLVPYGNEAALYKAMKEILVNKEKAQELGREGRKTVLRKFDINNISKQYMTLINQDKQIHSYP